MSENKQGCKNLFPCEPKEQHRVLFCPRGQRIPPHNIQISYGFSPVTHPPWLGILRKNIIYQNSEVLPNMTYTNCLHHL